MSSGSYSRRLGRRAAPRRRAGRRRRRPRRARVVEHDHRLHARDAPGELLDQGQQVGVDEDHPVLGVVDDVGELVGREPGVEGVQHPPAARHAEVGLEVAVVVPRQRGDRGAALDAEVVEGPHELLGPAGEGAVVVAVDGAVGEAGDDLGVAVAAAGVGEQQPAVQRSIHHRRHSAVTDQNSASSSMISSGSASAAGDPLGHLGEGEHGAHVGAAGRVQLDAVGREPATDRGVHGVGHGGPLAEEERTGLGSEAAGPHGADAVDVGLGAGEDLEVLEAALDVHRHAPSGGRRSRSASRR